MARSSSSTPELALPLSRSETAPLTWWSVTLAQGVAVTAPSIRVTARGEIAELDLRTRAFVGTDSLGATSGPPIGVTIVANPELVADINEGDEVLVVGTTRRRFFRTGGTTVARTEVEAVSVVKVNDRRRRNRTVDSAVAWIADVSAGSRDAKAARAGR